MYQPLVLHSATPFVSCLTSRVIDCTHHNSSGVTGELYGVRTFEPALMARKNSYNQGNRGGQGTA